MNQHSNASFMTSYAHGVSLVTTNGHVHVSNAATFESVLERVAKSSPSTIIVHFAHCGYFDSVAVGVLVKFVRLTSKNRVVLVAAPDSAAAKVLEIVGLRRLCAVVPSMGEALCQVAA